MLMTLALLGAICRVDAGLAPGVTYVEQPTGIEPSDYAAAWPELQPYLARLGEASGLTPGSELWRSLDASRSDGALNLQAQIERERGNLDEAERLIEKAIALSPKQHLHHFQQAMICFAHLSRASGSLERWKWHRQTRDAYQRAFDLNPQPVPYRYYLAYTYLQSPWVAGGDKNEALRLAQQGIDIGQKEFHVVRADVHRLREEVSEAFADYDRCIALKIFKLNSFVAAGRLALERNDLERARRYFEWTVHCRPDSPQGHEGIGDYYVVAGDPKTAAEASSLALQTDPTRASAREKLAKLRNR